MSSGLLVTVLLISMGVVLVLGLSVLLFTGRKRLSWLLELDQPVNLPELSDWNLFHQGGSTAGQHIAIVSIRNSGKTHVDKSALRTPFGFTFPGRQVLDAVVSGYESSTPKREKQHGVTIEPLSEQSPHPNSVTFAELSLRRQDCVQLLVLLSGSSADGEGVVETIGDLKSGNVVREGHHSMRRAFTTDITNTAGYVFLALFVAIALFLVGVWLSLSMS